MTDTCILSGKFTTPDGNVLTNSQVSFTYQDNSIVSGPDSLSVPAIIEVPTDAEGDFTIDLLPGHYAVQVRNGAGVRTATFKIYIPHNAVSIDIAEAMIITIPADIDYVGEAIFETLSNANLAAASATQATTSSTMASQSATAAAVSKTAADEVLVQVTAKHDTMAASVAAAATSATNAATERNAADTSASAASTSASEAASSAAASSTSATGSETHKTAAAGSATSALASKTAAETAATSASGSASTATTAAAQASSLSIAAATSATNALTAKTAAEASATAANTAKVAAETARTGALASETAAASSATAAATTAASSATTLNGLVTSAGTSAGQASSSATLAGEKAAIANAAASEAAASAFSANNAKSVVQTSATNANTSALQAAQSRNEAEGFATTAQSGATASAASATLAAASEAGVSADAASALTSKNAAAASQTAAASSATAAASFASAASTSASGALTDANRAVTARTGAEAAQVSAAGSAATAVTKATEANTSAGAAAGSAASALAVYGSVTAQQTAVATAQAQASLAQGYAASAASVVQQDLSGVTAQALHRSPNAVTAMAIYDTSKDSDGGAWTEKCQATSWWNEPIMGKWLGAHDSEFNARFANPASGPELISNGNFASGTTGWTTTSATVSVTGGVANIAPLSNLTRQGLSQAFTTVVGATYRLTYRVASGGGGNTHVYVGTSYASNANGSGSTAVGSRTLVFTATATTTVLTVGVWGISETLGIADTSIRLVTATTTASSDYFQLTTDGKFYRLWGNLFLHSEQLNNPAWAKVGTAPTITDNYAIGPNGAAATRLQFTASGSGNRINQIVSGSGGVRTLSFRMKGEAGGEQIAVWDGWSALNTTITLTTSWQQFTFTYTANNSSTGLYLYAVTGTPTVQVAELQHEYGNTATKYEIKTTVGNTTETFRGNKRDFPRLAGIVAESNSVTIYDLTEPGRPMWLRFFGDGAAYTYEFLPPFSITSFAILNGVLAIGYSYANLAYYGHLYLVNFPADTLKIHEGYYGRGSERVGGISLRQETDVLRLMTIPSPYYPSGDIRAIAMSVLHDAPIDLATGIKVPTIALATSSGVAVLKHNGTAANSGYTGGINRVAFIENQYLWASFGGYNMFIPRAEWEVTGFNLFGLNGYYAAGVGYESPLKALHGGDGTHRLARGDKYSIITGSKGTQLLKRHNVTTKAIAADITPTYNTGWLVGDVRRAYLSDAAVGAVSGPELVVNGSGSSTTGWSSNGGGSVTSNGSALVVTASGAYSGTMSENILFVSGKTYELVVVGRSVSGSGLDIRVDFTVTAPTVTSTSFVTVRQIFTATSTYAQNVKINSVSAGGVVEVDNISVREVVVDRSYKAQGAVVNGSLARAQLASGTSLVGYSGWSAANYLQEPYSADLEFGTGEWNISAWVNIPSSALTANYPTYGSDLLAGVGAFTSATGWSGLTADCTVAGGSLTKTGGATHYVGYPLPALALGDVLLVKFDVVAVSGSLGVRIGHAPGWNSSGVLTVGTNYRIFTAFAVSYGNVIGFDFPGGTTGTIQNLTVFKVKPSAIASRRHSSGAYIELVSPGPNYVQAVAFDGTTTRVVTAPAFTGADSNPVLAKDMWQKVEASYTVDGTLSISINGRVVSATRGTPLLTLNSRRNLANYSQGSSMGVSWGADSGGTSTRTDNAIIDPNGEQTAMRFVSTSPSYPNVSQNIAFPVAGTYCVSFWAKVPSGTLSTSGFTFTDTWQRFSTTVTRTVGTTTTLLFNLGPSAAIGVEVHVWGAQVEFGSVATAYQRTSLVAETNVAPLTIGNSFALDAPFPGSIALLKLGATVPTPEQATFMYEQEKQLFRAGAQSVMPDAGSLVDMAYDDATDRWVAISAANESYWTGLVRNSVTAVPAGSYSKIVAGSGLEMASRITTNPGVDVTIPAYGLREELVKRAEAAVKLSRDLVVYDYVGGFTATTAVGSTAITSVANLTYPASYIGARISGTGIPANTTIVGVSGTTIYISAPATAAGTAVAISFLDFELPVGMEAKTVMTAGLVKQEGPTKDYTRIFDGFIETIRYAVAPGATAWVQIQATKGAAA